MTTTMFIITSSNTTRQLLNQRYSCLTYIPAPASKQCRLDHYLHIHCQHTLMFKQHVKVNFASDDPFKNHSLNFHSNHF
ncbi:Myosin-11 [Labeo rohita]|uniref:Myosin-11 n=1 Tax=Labeo rohita TaxID=84645 RepID=A0ABQ8M1F8_LABRO|nr:Myosin-11 [Labeo rohita]